MSTYSLSPFQIRNLYLLFVYASNVFKITNNFRISGTPVLKQASYWSCFIPVLSDCVYKTVALVTWSYQLKSIETSFRLFKFCGTLSILRSNKFLLTILQLSTSSHFETPVRLFQLPFYFY